MYLLERFRRQPERPERVDERLLAFVPSNEILNPLDILARHRREPRSGLVEDELAQVAGDEGCAQPYGRAVRVAEEVRRLVDRVDDGGHILELAVDRVLHGIAALAAATAIDREDGKAIDQGGDEEVEAPVGARRPVDEHERRPLAAPPVPDPRSVA